MFKQLYRILSCLLLSFTLVHCAGGFYRGGSSSSVSWNQSGPYFLNLANATNATEEKTPYLLAAAQAFLKQHQPSDAKAALHQVDVAQLSDSEHTDYNLTAASLALHENRVQQALSILESLHDNLSPEQEILSLRLKVKAYAANNQIIESVNTRIALQPLLDEPNEKSQNSAHIWHDLQSLSLEALTSTTQTNPQAPLQGWLDLVVLTKTKLNDPAAFVQALTDWKTRYPNHEAQSFLSNVDLQSIQEKLSQPIEHVALLLPLTGEFSAEGHAIKNSFVVASQQNHAARPLTITTCDTEKKSARICYDEAIQAGAQAIVGPLQKSVIDTFLDDVDPSIPTLILNVPDNMKNQNGNVYYFGLSPIDELTQLTKEIRGNGYKNALLIYSDDDWGNNTRKQFANFYSDRGGNIVDTLSFDPKSFKDYSDQIASFLGVDASEKHQAELEKASHKKMPFTAKIRDDVDVIFLIASPQQARQINPLLKFHYAGNLPIYSLSSIYSGQENTRLDRDLDDIIFTDLPWLITPDEADKSLRTSLQASAAQDYRYYPRLVAFGVDSYRLIANQELALLPLFQEMGLPNATGLLNLESQRLTRKLPFAKFERGSARQH